MMKHASTAHIHQMCGKGMDGIIDELNEVLAA
jgi:hypothetical protein